MTKTKTFQDLVNKIVSRFYNSFINLIGDLQGIVTHESNPQYSENLAANGILRSTPVKHCCVCGKPLMGVVSVDWEGNAVCNDHKSCICSSCHRFYGRDATEVEKGIFLCHSCTTHLVTYENAKYVVGKIRNFYRQIGLEIKSPIKLDVSTVQLFHSKYGKNSRGVAIFPPDKDGYHVVILRHLSQSSFASVMAHEMLHIWQFENKIDPPAMICEGFCNLGSYLFMQSIGSPTARGLVMQYLYDDSEIYGKGFAKMKDLYDNDGINGVLTEIRKYKCTK